MTSTVHVAPVVLTLTGAPLRDGAVAVDGDRVVAVGPAADVLAAAPAARVRRHAGVLTPGLVDAHAHLELGPSFAGLPPEALAARRRATDDGAWLVEARGSVHALLRSGTTCVADLASTGPGVRAAALAGLAGVSYAAADAPDPVRVTALAAAAGRTPSVPLDARCGLAAVGGLADLALPVPPGGATARGAVPGLARSVPPGGATARGAVPGLAPPVPPGGATARGAVPDLAPPVPPGGATAPGASSRPVVCPRSDALLGLPPVRLAGLLAAGGPFAVGTCCLAVVPDLDLLAELRAARDVALAQGTPGRGLAEALVRAVTVDAAAVLGLPGSGVLAAGVRADLAVFDVPADGDPWEALVEHGAGRCTATVLAGRLVHRR